jgi:hypothetical protein
MWLTDPIFSHNIFLLVYKVYLADSVCNNAARGSRALIAISLSVFGVKCRFNVEFVDEPVSMKIAIRYDSNPLIGICIGMKLITSGFNYLENVFDTQNFRVVLTGDFSFPSSDSKTDLLFR